MTPHFSACFFAMTSLLFVGGDYGLTALDPDRIHDFAPQLPPLPVLRPRKKLGRPLLIRRRLLDADRQTELVGFLLRCLSGLLVCRELAHHSPSFLVSAFTIDDALRSRSSSAARDAAICT